MNIVMGHDDLGFFISASDNGPPSPVDHASAKAWVLGFCRVRPVFVNNE